MRRTFAQAKVVPRRGPWVVEMVGIAGVGKSHLQQRLLHHLAPGATEPYAHRVAPPDLRSLVVAIGRFAPLFVFMLLSSRSTLRERLRYSAVLLGYAVLEERAARSSPPPAVMISGAGWYHKLRRIRRLVRPDLAYADLPVAVRRRLFQADVVVLVTADAAEVCARKLRRRNIAVTPESLARQHAESAARGQWQEEALTRRDLAQATASVGLEVVEVDYRTGYDVARELLPRLEQLGIVPSARGGVDGP